MDTYLTALTFSLQKTVNPLSKSKDIAFLASGKFWVNNHAHVVKTLGSMPLGFLKAYTNSVSLQGYVTGTTRLKLTKSALNGAFHVPPPSPPRTTPHRCRNREAVQPAGCFGGGIEASAGQLETVQVERAQGRLRGQARPDRGGTGTRRGQGLRTRRSAPRPHPGGTPRPMGIPAQAPR